MFSLLNLGSKIGQPQIKYFKDEFSRTGKLNLCVMTEVLSLKKCGTFFINNVVERVKNMILKLVQ